MIGAILFNLCIQKTLIFITIFCPYFVYIPSAISPFTQEQSLFKYISYIVLWNTIYISFKNSNLLLNITAPSLLPTLCSAASIRVFALAFPTALNFASRQIWFTPSIPNVRISSGSGAALRISIPLLASGFPYTVLYSGKYILNQRLILF